MITACETVDEFWDPFHSNEEEHVLEFPVMNNRPPEVFFEGNLIVVETETGRQGFSIRDDADVEETTATLHGRQLRISLPRHHAGRSHNRTLHVAIP